MALGIARGAIDAFFELTRSKTVPRITGLLRDDPLVQFQVARAEAGWESARSYLHSSIQDAWQLAPTKEPIPLDSRAHLRLAATHAIHAAADSVDTVYKAAGATAIFAEDNPFERRSGTFTRLASKGRGARAISKLSGSTCSAWT